MGENKKMEKKKPILVTVIILLVITLTGAGVFAGVYISSKRVLPVQAQVNNAVDLATLPLDEFLVNLADEGSKRYLKVVIYISYDGKNKALTEELALDRIKPILKDSALTVIRSKKSSDFATIEGTETVKKELVDKFNSRIQNGKIIEVLFPELIIQ